MLFPIRLLTKPVALLPFLLLTAHLAFAHSGHDHDTSGPSIKLPDVVARVGEQDIRKDAIWKSLTQSVERYKKRGLTLSPAQEKIAANKLIQDEISRHLLLKRAKDLKVDVTPDQVAARLTTVKKSFSSPENFEKKLAQEGLSLESYKDEIKTDLVIDQVVEKDVGPHIKVSDGEISSYYEKNKASYSKGEQRRASVILVEVVKHAGAEGEKKAKEKIEKVLKLAREGKDFSALAKNFSEDSLAKRGGDLGFFQKGQTYPPFEKHAFGMNVGDVSDVFRTDHGYQVLKVTGKKEAKTQTLGDAKEKISNAIRERKIKEKTRQYIDDLKKKTKIKIYFK